MNGVDDGIRSSNGGIVHNMGYNVYMRLPRLQYALFLTILFLLPSNLFFKFFVQSAYVHGILVDYLIPKLYLVDLPIILLLMLWAVEASSKRRKRLRFSVTFLPLLVFGVLQAFTKYPLASLWFLWTVAETVLFGLWMLTHKTFLKNIWTSITLASAVFFQTALAAYQFAFQRTLGGYFLLGEPALQAVPSIAKTEVLGQVRILPYGTLPHPNVLAGFLLVYLLLLFLLRKPGEKKAMAYMRMLSFAAAAIGIVLTQSVTAMLAFLAGVVLFVLQKTKTVHLSASRIVFLGAVASVLVALAVVLATPFTENASIVRRAQLERIAFRVFLDNPLFGVGLNQFATYVETYGGVVSQTQFLQPTHNILLLIIAETGIFGCLVLFLFAYSEHKKYRIVLREFFLLFPVIILISSLDHYAYTLHQGQLLTAILITFMIEKKGFR